MLPSAELSDLWLRRYRPVDDPEIRLVCFPHAGGAASAFLPFTRELPPTVEVLAVQYPGRQDRRSEPFIDCVDGLVEHVVPALLHWSDRPLALFGHSLGATVAFETAHRLSQAGSGRPVHLFVSGRRAPTAAAPGGPHPLDDEELTAEIRRLQGTDASLLADDDLLNMVLPAIRNDYRAAASYRYRPGPLLRCPVTVLTGSEDPDVTSDEAAAWGELTSAGSVVRAFPGGHFYLNGQLTAVCAEIMDALAPQVSLGTTGALG